MRILLPIGIALLSACSSSSASVPSVDTGVAPDDTGAASDTAEPSAKNLGFVDVRRDKTPDKSFVSMSGAFYQASSVVCPTVVDAGSCQYSRCPTGSPVTGPLKDAGVISIVRGTDPPIELTKARSYVNPTELLATYFAEGDQFTFSSTGGDVPAFTGVALTAPGDLAMTLPTDVDRTKDLVVTWTGGMTGNVHLALSGSLEMEKQDEGIYCSGPASAGTLTIPKELLGKLAAATGYLSVEPSADQSVESSDWIVGVHVTALGASGPVTIH